MSRIPAVPRLASFGMSTRDQKYRLKELQAPPQPIGKDVVQSASTTVHADADVLIQQELRVFRTRKMTVLIAVDDLRFYNLQGMMDRSEDKVQIQQSYAISSSFKGRKVTRR